MDQLRRDGDSVGARIEVVADSVSPGWGEPLYDRLDADDRARHDGSRTPSRACPSATASRAIAQRGSEHASELTPGGLLSPTTQAVLGTLHRAGDHGVAGPSKPTLPASASSAARSTALASFVIGADAWAGTTHAWHPRLRPSPRPSGHPGADRPRAAPPGAVRLKVKEVSSCCRPRYFRAGHCLASVLLAACARCQHHLAPAPPASTARSDTSKPGLPSAKLEQVGCACSTRTLSSWPAPRIRW